MPAEPFRFVHAADLHLEQPIHGLAETPDHLRAALIDAPYIAAERVFDATLAESADFLILSGDVLNVHYAGPRAIAFLLEQFERLAARGIAVYWAGAKEDPPETWPPAARLPANVHVFSRGEMEEFTHFRGDEPMCRVVGISCNSRQRLGPADFRGDPEGLFTLAVAHGSFDAEELTQQPIDYWALGGPHERQSLCTTPHTAHCAGSPQGRCPAEAGPHGCTLASVDVQRKIRTQLIATDALRWHDERLTIGDDATRDDLGRLLRERMLKLAAESPQRGLLVAWTIEAAGPLSERSRLGWPSRRAKLAADLVQSLREEFGHGEPPVWTASLDFELSDEIPPAWYEEDTILGDFLRAVQVHQADDQQPLNVSAYLSQRQTQSALASALQLADRDVRQQVLREAAALGVELLRGESTAVAR